MPPFATIKTTTKNTRPLPDDFNHEMSLLYMAKKVGLSFDELNELTLQDFYDLVDMWIGEENDAPRDATQDDIDRFYRIM